MSIMCKQKKMRLSTILCTLNLRFPVRFSSSVVAPLPIQSSFDTWLTEQLHTLLCLKQKTVETETSYTSCEWLLQALDISIATQKKTVKSLNDDDGMNVLRDGDQEIIEEYLEEVIQLLDACNQLRERTGTIQNYVNSLRIVLHCFEGRTKPSETVLARSRIALNSCEAMEKSFDDQLEKCNSNLRKLGGRLAQTTSKDSYMSNINTNRFREALNGSKAVSLLTCGSLAVSLSFKSKRGLPVAQNGEIFSYCWLNSLKELEKEVKQEIEKCRKSGAGIVLNELREAVTAAKNLRETISPRRPPENKARKMDLISVNVEDLGRSCEELEEGIEPFEGKVNELYRQLISVRVALLGILSQA